MDGIGWLLVTLVTLVILLKVRSKKRRPRCPVCGELVKDPAIYDKSTDEYYHPVHWLEYAKQELINEITTTFYRKIRT